nr:MAG TPA: hypothetical protein [Caudoviricetes sp.]
MYKLICLNNFFFYLQSIHSYLFCTVCQCVFWFVPLHL